jgi:chromosome segregation ATPase
MSWRANIPELRLLQALTIIIDDLTKSYAKLSDTEKSLNDQLRQVNKDLKELGARRDDIKVFEKKQLEAGIDEIDTETDTTDQSNKFDELVERIQDGVDDVEEKAQVLKRIAELRARKFQIENTEEARIAILQFIIQTKLGVVRGLVPVINGLQSLLENLLDRLENIIDSVSSIPVIGQIISVILGLIVKIIEQKIYQPVKDANTAFTEAENVIPRVFDRSNQ